MMYNLNSLEIHAAHSNAISLWADVPPLRPALTVSPIAPVEFVHFIGDNVKAFKPASFLNPSNSRGLSVELCDGECVLPATPSNEGGTTAYVMMFFAINRNCDNPDLAREFSKCMLEETFQSNFEAHGGIPVIKNMQPESYAYLCRKYSAGNDAFVETMTSDFQKSIGNITSAVTAFECNDVYLLLDKFTPYINDEKSYEDCLTEAINFFSIYLAE